MIKQLLQYWTVWYKNIDGSQNFGYQIWCLFCNICNVLKNMFNLWTTFIGSHLTKEPTAIPVLTKWWNWELMSDFGSEHQSWWTKFWLPTLVLYQTVERGPDQYNYSFEYQHKIILKNMFSHSMHSVKAWEHKEICLKFILNFKKDLRQISLWHLSQKIKAGGHFLLFIHVYKIWINTGIVWPLFSNI